MLAKLKPNKSNFCCGNYSRAETIGGNTGLGTYNKSPCLNFGTNSSFPKQPFNVPKPMLFFPTSTLKSIEPSEGKRKRFKYVH